MVFEPAARSFNLRILEVCNTDFYLNRFLKPLILKLLGAGYHVECACQGSSIDPEIREAGVLVHSFDFPQKSSPVSFGAAIWKMRKLIRSRRFGCVNSHNRNASIVARLAAWTERVPINLYTAHGFYFHDDQSRIKREATIALEAILGRFTDFTLSQSAEDTELMVGRGLISEQAIKTIGNGIDPVRFRPASNRTSLEASLGLSSGPFRVVSIGRLVSGKGFSDLLLAFKALHHQRPRTELLIVGGNIAQDISPASAQFMEMVRDLKLEAAVRVTGITDRVAEYLASADLFVLPSYREGLPRVLLEAMAAGLPVIATDIRGCREACLHGETGYLFPPHDVRALGRLLLRVHDLPSSARGELGAKGRARVLEYFTEGSYLEAQVSEIRRLASALHS